MFEKVVRLFSGKKSSQGISAVLSPTSHIKNETQIVTELFESGLHYYHLRRPRWNQERVEAWIKRIPAEYRTRIILHEHPQLVAIYKLGGFHITNNCPLENVPQNLVAQCQSYDDLEKLSVACQYITLGPIFPSPKRDLTVPVRTPEEYAAILAYWRKKNPSAKLLAFGGICEENIKLCKKMGFDGFACVGAIWDSKISPIQAFKNLKKKW